ncbi:MAG: AAA family ATPase [Polyangiaceae bacterium]|nr:AAA family ATPase [Polyangiaceae bacterium]
MSAPLFVPEERLPEELSAFDAVVAAYPAEVSAVVEALSKGLPVLVECDKEVVPYFFRTIRDRLKASGRRAIYLDGRPPAEPEPGAPSSTMDRMMVQLRDAVRGAVDERVVVLPHLDLLTTTTGELSSFAREVVALLYENPAVVWLGFRDVSFRVPEVISALFPRKVAIVGVPRDRLSALVTRREARKLGRGLSPYRLYKYVSGVNAVRLRRLLSTLEGDDYPEDPRAALGQLRAATAAGDVQLPDVDLRRDIGGYERIKERLSREVLEILEKKDAAADPERVRTIEQLVPRGMIFWGPPGTGKTLFAKALATALGAAVIVVSGPELKSKWVGESEENLRRVFLRARQSAPAIIVFDEIDAFAAARGTFEGSGVEHSMVNQLLTEMDGFRSNEMVFVVGTTNLPQSLDPALLRPGRFEFLLHIPFPDALDRAAILAVHGRNLGLKLSDAAIEYAVRRTEGLVEGSGSRYTGDHLQALCRAIARRRLREGIEGVVEPDDIERALIEYVDRPRLTSAEERVVATHEAGHAVVALFSSHAPPIERISIQGDLGGSLGAVSFSDPAHRYVVTQWELEDRLAILFGGREAELLVLGHLSAGAQEDLAHATLLARSMATELGMANEGFGLVGAVHPEGDGRKVSEATRARIDDAVRAILDAARARAAQILSEQRAVLESLRDLLVERKIIDRAGLAALAASQQGEGGARG